MENQENWPSPSSQSPARKIGPVQQSQISFVAEKTVKEICVDRELERSMWCVAGLLTDQFYYNLTVSFRCLLPIEYHLLRLPKFRYSIFARRRLNIKSVNYEERPLWSKTQIYSNQKISPSRR